MKKLLFSILFAVSAVANLAPITTYASSTSPSVHVRFAADDAAKKCRDDGGVPTSGVLGTKCVGGDQGGGYQNPIFAMTSKIIYYAVGFMGLAMVGLLVFAGIRYITSAGNPDDVKAAKGMITQVLTALVLFAIMGAVLTLILPVDDKEKVELFRNTQP